MARMNWTHDELIVAFNLYCKTPFGRIDKGNPEIIALAKTIGRTPSAVSYKLANFASLDPALKARGIHGAGHGSKADEEVWNEFSQDWERLAFESERLLAQITETPLEQSAKVDVSDVVVEGKERDAIVRVRVNQSFFRVAVLTAYSHRCCISGIAVPELLNASHIVPWATDTTNRVNPRNGLCLNVLLDRAYDRGFLTVTPEKIVKISKIIQQFPVLTGLNEWLIQFDGKPIHLPERFPPNGDFLQYHYSTIYKG